MSSDITPGEADLGNGWADPELANTAFRRKAIELQAGQHGISIVADVPLLATSEPTPKPKTPGRSIALAVNAYLLETKNGKRKVRAYQTVSGAD